MILIDDVESHRNQVNMKSSKTIMQTATARAPCNSANRSEWVAPGLQAESLML